MVVTSYITKQRYTTLYTAVHTLLGIHKPLGLKKKYEVIKAHRTFTVRSECAKVLRLDHMSSGWVNAKWALSVGWLPARCHVTSRDPIPLYINWITLGAGLCWGHTPDSTVYLFTRTEQTLRRHSSNLSIVSYRIYVANLSMNEFRNAHGRMGGIQSVNQQ